MDKYQKFRDHEISQGVTVRQLQMKIFEIFKYLKQICEDNGLTYWCGGGTMLGAVRHKGFIPWDDDLDVFMPRKDYETLYRRWNELADTSHYVLSRTDRSHNNHHAAMKLIDITTTYVNRHSENEDNIHGVYIDVIPFEGCPDSKLGRAVQIYHSVMYGIFNCQRLPDNQGKLLRFPVKVMLSLIKDPQTRYNIWKRHEAKMARYDFFTAKYVKETVTSFRGLFRLYTRDMFDTVDADFEDIKIKIPAGYDAYMKAIFGDYMKEPEDVESSMAGRYWVIKFVSLDEPYTNFRGIHYLEGGKEA